MSKNENLLTITRDDALNMLSVLHNGEYEWEIEVFFRDMIRVLFQEEVVVLDALWISSWTFDRIKSLWKESKER
jgi:hypothetical protein